MTLPTKPSHTTTSAAPSNTSRPSTLPTKLTRGSASSSAYESRTSSLPLVRSSPMFEQTDARALDTEVMLGEHRAHDGELDQILGSALVVGADIQTPPHRRACWATRSRWRGATRRAGARWSRANSPPPPPCSPRSPSRPPYLRAPGAVPPRSTRPSCDGWRSRVIRACRWSPTRARSRSARGRRRPPGGESLPRARPASGELRRVAQERRRSRRARRPWGPCRRPSRQPRFARITSYSSSSMRTTSRPA